MGKAGESSSGPLGSQLPCGAAWSHKCLSEQKPIPREAIVTSSGGNQSGQGLKSRDVLALAALGPALLEGNAN